MTRTITATEARIRFGELLRRVAENGETVVVERSGRPQAMVVPIEEYERLTGSGEHPKGWTDLMQRASRQVADELHGRRLPPADEILRKIREERDAHLLGLR